jgi:hypothetical protein
MPVEVGHPCAHRAPLALPDRASAGGTDRLLRRVCTGPNRLSLGDCLAHKPAPCNKLATPPARYLPCNPVLATWLIHSNSWLVMSADGVISQHNRDSSGFHAYYPLFPFGDVRTFSPGYPVNKGKTLIPFPAVQLGHPASMSLGARDTRGQRVAKRPHTLPRSVHLAMWEPFPCARRRL